MLDLFGNRQERGRLAAALCLMAAEAAGFAAGGAGELAVMASVVAAVLALAAFGWSSRALALGAIAAAGLALAGLCGLRESSFMEACSNGGDVALELTVASKVSVKDCGRRGRFAEFTASPDGAELKVVMPIVDGGRVPSPGERWKCIGRVGLRRTMWCKKGASQIIESARNGLYGFYASLNAKASRSLDVGLSRFPVLAALNKGILLGVRDAIPRETMRDFRAAGIAHVLAVSGLHVMFIVAIISAALKIARLPEKARAIVTLSPIAAYVLLAGAKASAARAGVMAALYLGSEALGRERSSISWWSTAAIILYAANPRLVLDAGSTLSFTVMIGIILWMRSTRGVSARFAPFMEKHPWVKKAVSLQSIGFAAWFSGVPVSAAYFGTITPAGLLTGAPAVLLAGFQMGFAALGAVLGGISEPLAAFGNIPAAALALMETLIAKLGASIPYGHFKVEGWGIAATAVWYALFLSLMAGMRWLGFKRRFPVKLR